MKKIILSALIFVVGQNLKAQVGIESQYEYDWVVTQQPTSTQGKGEVFATTTDPSGNVYTTGVFKRTVNFMPGSSQYIYTSPPPTMSLFIQKVNAAGNIIWIKTIIPSPSEDIRAYSIAADNGGVYLTGFFTGQADFDPSSSGVATRTSSGAEDIFILKLNQLGNYQFAYTMGGNEGTDLGASIAIDNSNLYVGGTFRGSFDADPSTPIVTATSKGGTDFFILKMSLAGTFSWIKTMGSTANDISWDGINDRPDFALALDGTGNIYSTGSFLNTIDFNPSSFGIYNLSASSLYTDIFFQKLSPSGAFVWAKKIGGNYNDRARAITIKGNNIYSTGMFTGTNVNFDPNGSFLLSTSSTSNGDIYVEKLDLNGAFVWAKQMGGTTGSDMGNGITLNAGGTELYITGFFRGTADFDPSSSSYAPLTSLSTYQQNSFISSLDAVTGGFWGRKLIGGPGLVMSRSICTSVNDEIYTGGYFENTVDFNMESPVVNITPLARAGFLHKLKKTCITTNTNPGLEWATDMGGEGTTFGTSIKVDDAGNVYTTGYFSGDVDFDPGVGDQILHSFNSTYDIYVEKQDALGNLIWVKHIKGVGTEKANTIDVDASGNVIIGGTYTDRTDFNPDPILNYHLQPNPVNVEDAFICKLDNNGNFLWVNQIGADGSDICKSLVADANGNIFATGAFSEIVNFDPAQIAAPLTALGYNDIYVVKYDASGNFVWVKQAGGTNSEIGNSISLDPTGQIMVTGEFAGTVNFNLGGTPSSNLTSQGGLDAFVWKLNPTAGASVWVKQISGADDQSGTAITTDANSNTYVTGAFTGSTNFSGTTISSVGINNMYVMAIKGNGVVSWIKTVNAYALPNSITTDDCGDIYTIGYYNSTVDFNPGVGTANYTSNGSFDVFIQKLKKTGEFVWAKSVGGLSADKGCDIDVDMDASVYTVGIFLSSQVDFNPGSGVTTLSTSNGFQDAFVQKFNLMIDGTLRMSGSETSSMSDFMPNSILVYPNPSAGKFNIEFTDIAVQQITVFDALGKVVSENKVEANLTNVSIDLSEYPSGIYFIKLNTGEKTIMKKVVKE